ncbi:MAG: CocE/NonD family hydrolase [Ruminococcaceae bacterium]|nr:CocE/NonD family hydrolase [Oscillospiraceae bacterium]
MISATADYQYIESNGAKLFTVILLPDATGKFPVIVIRNPYVDRLEQEKEDNIAIDYLNEHREWLRNGYGVVVQHCRGRGKSEGDCIPYINEREDGLVLQEWIRNQAFYNGEIYLKGLSYLTSVHYATAPFADDIKGAIFGIQDSERYNICYRNGFLKKALHGSWYVGMYKAKSHIKKNYTDGSFDMLPLKDFTKTVFGEEAEDFNELLKAPNPDHPFWNTRFGGNDARGATANVKFPVLFTTGFYDIYTGGIFDMWGEMSENGRKMSALVVSPYDHGDCCDPANSIVFPNGKRIQQFGEFYEIDWLNFVRGKKEKSPFELGKITYYNSFKNCWQSDEFLESSDQMKVLLGEEEVSYVYNPYDAPKFKGGLSRTFGGTVYQDKPNSRHDIISIYSSPFEQDVCVKGKMSANLTVKSDCEDTCFYVRISIEKDNGDYGLRDDITSLCYQLGDYKPDSVVELNFEFDEHAFLIRKGERLRIDIASADNEHYVRHTNQKGLYSEQTTAKMAHNTIYLKKSFLTLPVSSPLHSF